MHNFNFKRRNLASGPHLLGSLLLLAGVFALVSPLLLKGESSMQRVLVVGVGAIILGLLIVSSYGGTLIDFTGKRCQDYFSIAGYRFGEWTTLPAIHTVKVVAISYIHTNKPNGISPTLSKKVTDFRILVYADAFTPVFSFVYANKKKAVRNAGHLASHLNAELVLNLPERA